MLDEKEASVTLEAGAALVPKHCTLLHEHAHRLRESDISSNNDVDDDNIIVPSQYMHRHMVPRDPNPVCLSKLQSEDVKTCQTRQTQVLSHYVMCVPRMEGGQDGMARGFVMPAQPRSPLVLPSTHPPLHHKPCTRQESQRFPVLLCSMLSCMYVHTIHLMYLY